MSTQQQGGAQEPEAPEAPRREEPGQMPEEPGQRRKLRRCRRSQTAIPQSRRLTSRATPRARGFGEKSSAK
jgi:hypothetical protein